MTWFSETMFRGFLFTCLAVAFVACCTPAQGQVQDPDLILRVDGDDGSPTGDGETWGSAFKFLQDAIAFALDQLDPPEVATIWIWVAATEPANPYRPDRTAAIPDGTRDRNASFNLHSGITLYGGFTGDGEDDLADRDPEANVTVLTGAQPPQPPAVCGQPGSGDCFSANGTPGCVDADCCAMVCAALPLCCDSAWDGDCASLAGNVCGTCGEPGSGDCFTAHGTPGCEDADCCAVVCEQNPLCCANEWQMGCAQAAADICPGDAYHVVTGADVVTTARLNGFTITGGNADGSGNDASGGGVLLTVSGQFGLLGDPVIARCRITGNRAVNGAGLATIADVQGQGLFPTVIDCAFTDNDADGDGGAVHSGVKAGGSYTNCLFADNTAGGDGGAMLVLGNKDHSMINCTVAANVAGGDGGGVFVDQVTNGPAFVTLDNSIVWDNTDSGPQDGSAQLFVLVGQGGSVTFSTGDIQGGIPPNVVNGGGNIELDPMFVASPADLHLLFGSPCIDTGDEDQQIIPQDQFDVDDDNNTSEPTPDLDMIDRVLDGPGVTVRVDMGAYEFCKWDCMGYDRIVGISEFLYVLGNWGSAQEDPCDFNADGIIGIDEFLAVLGHWGPCSGPAMGPPESVNDCIERFGSEDPQVLLHCICMFEPCEQGCPPDPSCQ